MISFSFKVIWSKQSVGIAVDQEISSLKIQVPLTSYYFWPSFNGWKLLKNRLELIPWLTQSDQIKILNGYTKIITLWKSNNGDLKNFTSKELSEIQKNLNFKLVGLTID